MISRRVPRSTVAIVCLVLGLRGSAGPAAEYESWSAIENAAETRGYGEMLRAGRFDAAEKAFLSQSLLPQLALEANRDDLGDVRGELRERAVEGATAAAVVDAINREILAYAGGLAGDDQTPPAVRFHAMLLVGELEGADGRPWPAAVPALAEAAGNAGMPPEVRLAAMIGLSRLATAGRPDDAFRGAAGPVLATLITEPPNGDPVAGNWLRSRAIDILPAVPPEGPVLQAVAAILADTEAGTNLRIRAARALGRLAAPEAGLDGPAIVKAIGGLAGDVLRQDLEGIKRRRFDRQISGSGGMGGMGGMMGPGGFGAPAFGGGMRPPEGGFMMGPEAGFEGGPGGEGAKPVNPLTRDEDTIGPLACRQTAWRLFVLAEAIKPRSGGGGIAGLLDGDAAGEAAALADDLRRASADLDDEPSELMLRDVVDMVGPAVGIPQARDDAGTARPQGRPGSPFGPPGGGSPF